MQRSPQHILVLHQHITHPYISPTHHTSLHITNTSYIPAYHQHIPAYHTALHITNTSHTPAYHQHITHPCISQTHHTPLHITNTLHIPAYHQNITHPCISPTHHTPLHITNTSHIPAYHTSRAVTSAATFLVAPLLFKIDNAASILTTFKRCVNR